MSKRAEIATTLVEWASMKCGPYADAYKVNMRIRLVKSNADLVKLAKLQPRERMHDINLIMSGSKSTLFCGTVSSPRT